MARHSQFSAIRKYAVIAFLFTTFGMLTSISTGLLYAADESVKHILILHSYHPDFTWTRNIMTGMEEELSAYEPNVALVVEYMDTKRFFDQKHISDILEKNLFSKLASRTFDIILLSDNDALNFALKHRNDLFASTPIVFCGVNNYTPAMISGLTGITGVAEIPSYRETLELALRLHPETKEIFVFNTTGDITARAQRQNLVDVMPQFQNRINFVLWDDFSLEDLAAKLRQLPENSLFFLNSSNIRHKSGAFASLIESIRAMRAASPVPIYSLWEPYLGIGIVGGKLVSGTKQGRLAAQLALLILQGENPDHIAVIDTAANEFMFDYNELKRFGIPLKMLPKDSVVINPPPPFYTVNKEHLWAAVIVMSIITAALLVNILRRRQAERKLRLAHRQLLDIIEFLPDATFVIDQNKKVIAWNRAIEEMTGIPKEDIVGKGDYAYAIPFYGKPRPLLLDLIDSPELEKETRYDFLEKRGETLFVEQFFPTVYGGKGAYVLATASRLFDQAGNFVGAIESIRDISERKQWEEELKRANQELAAFVYTVSHDLRTPLTPIIGYAEVLQERFKDRLDRQGLDLLNEIEKQGRKMLALMEDLLTLAKIGRLEKPAEATDTASLVQEVIENLKSETTERGVTIRQNPLPPIHVPRTLLTQIFDNLIGNAIRYACKNGDTIEIGGERQGERVKLFVRDHGPGIPETERERIFEVFYRGAGGVKLKGTGVGLATVEKIARLYKGKAWVEETPGGGSTFWVEMVDSP